MKKLFIVIILVLNVSFICSQDMLIKKITNTDISNFHIYDYYKYNVDWKLDSVIEVTELGDTIRLFLFENDSLKAEIQTSNIWTYEYFGDDSIVEFTSSEPNNWNTYKSGVYYVNSDFEILSYEVLNIDGSYLWTYYYTYLNGNCIDIFNPDGLHETMDYSSYLNPFLNEKKYFRRAFQGSVNFMEFGDFRNSDIEFVVNSSLNNYPVLVDNYIDNEFFSASEFEYYNLTKVEKPEINTASEILEVNYFNLLGQRIEKPTKGIYIEMVTTSDGTISNKKFAY